MEIPTTKRTKAITDGLYQDGYYSQAKEIDVLAQHRDDLHDALWKLVCAASPFLRINKHADYSFGEVKDSDIERLKEAHNEALLFFKPKTIDA